MSSLCSDFLILARGPASFLPLTGFPTTRSTGPLSTLRPSHLKPLVFIFFSHGMFFPQHIKIAGSFSIFSFS